VPQLSGGWQEDTTVVRHFVDIHRAVIERMRERIAATEEPDPVTQDLFIQITAALEKQYWMFQAEQA
jgi:starvation-inducible DNA-binding protein